MTEMPLYAWFVLRTSKNSSPARSGSLQDKLLGILMHRAAIHVPDWRSGPSNRSLMFDRLPHDLLLDKLIVEWIWEQY